ncbi:MAG: lipoprotein [Paracoccaceae bacterium]
MTAPIRPALALLALVVLVAACGVRGDPVRPGTEPEPAEETSAD